MNNNKNVQVTQDDFEVTELTNSSPLDQGMMQVRTQYSTAVQVVKPRNLQVVIKKCEEEASIAGDDFYYSWKQGKEIIEGVTIGGALAIARNWGNSAVDVKIEETPTSFIFHGAFIDLETGFNLVRPFRQNKISPKKKIIDKSTGETIMVDTYTGERGMDVIFQTGASKAMRNAILNAVPKWLSSKVLAKAKENIFAKIEKMGIEKAIALVTKKLTALGIPIETVEKDYGLQKGWDLTKLVQLSGAIRSIEEGYESAESIFPALNKTHQAQPPVATKEEPKAVTAAATPETPLPEPILQTESKPEPELEFQPDSPAYWISRIKRTKTKTELKTFVKEYGRDFTVFQDSDILKIQDAITTHEKKLK